jgi:O-antigen/teichoic acid export membrane protein
VLSGVAAVAAKIVAIGTALFTIPLTLAYLGTERFGLWMTISSVLALLGFADFGIGNGVLNLVAEAFGRNDKTAVRNAISSGLFTLSVISVVVLVSFCGFYTRVNWANLFNVHSPVARAEAGPSLAVFAFCFAASIPLGIVQRVQLGLQEGFRANLWQLIGSVAGLVGVLGVLRKNLGMPWLVLALAGCPVMAALLNGIVFSLLRSELRPSYKAVSSKLIKKVVRTGLLFFVLQLVVAIAFSSDNFILTRTLGPEAVTSYAVPQKMFSVVSLLLAVFMAPLWPAYGEAISRGDKEWVKHTLAKTLTVIACAAILGSAMLVTFGKTIVAVWTHGRVNPAHGLLLALGIWTVFDCCGNATAMFLNGANIIRAQVIIASIFGIGCLVCRVIFVRYFGIVGIPSATILTYGLLSALPMAIIIPRILKDICSAPRTADVPVALMRLSENRIQS